MKHSHIINSVLGKVCFAFFLFLSSTQSYGYTSFYFSDIFEVFQTELVEELSQNRETTEVFQQKVTSSSKSPAYHSLQPSFKYLLNSFAQSSQTAFSKQNRQFSNHKFDTILKIHFFYHLPILQSAEQHS